MFQPLKKIEDFSQKFLSNLSKQLQNEKNLPDFNALIHKTPLKSKLSKIYEGFQLADYFLFQVTKDYSPIKKENTGDKMKGNLMSITQQQSDISNEIPFFIFDKLIQPFEKFINFDFYKDFKVIRKIETTILPKILQEIFTFETKQNMSLEAEETSKELKKYIFDQEEWKDKEIYLDNVRMVETKKIQIKNFKKTITVEFEFTAALQGETESKEKPKKKCLKLHFGGMIDFIHENGKWIANSFGFTPLS